MSKNKKEILEAFDNVCYETDRGDVVVSCRKIEEIIEKIWPAQTATKESNSLEDCIERYSSSVEERERLRSTIIDEIRVANVIKWKRMPNVDLIATIGERYIAHIKVYLVGDEARLKVHTHRHTLKNFPGDRHGEAAAKAYVESYHAEFVDLILSGGNLGE